jgi:serine protein kinase
MGDNVPMLAQRKEKTMDSNPNTDLLAGLFDTYDREEFLTVNTQMSFDDYVAGVLANPAWIRTAYQRVYDMIMSAGTRPFQRYRRTLTHYDFFDAAECPIFGLEETLDNLVKFFRGAAGGYGTEKRVLLLHGPVGSSKSTICRAIKRGMERYSRTNDGAWFTYRWVNLPTGPNGLFVKSEDESPMNEDPILFLPPTVRADFLRKANERWQEMCPDNRKISQYNLRLEGDVNPRSRLFLNALLKEYKGDYLKLFTNHIQVIRKVYSEADRVGIGTFQPKDEKNQDATELTGDINYALLAQIGADSDGRAFNFDGEFCVANRGVCEFIEMLKLAKEFLYDLLGASQEHSIKPKKFPQVYIDEVIIGHTNNPEYEKLTNDRTMEALRDRTIKVDVPYLLRLQDEIKVYEMDYSPAKVRQHVAPHTLEMAAFFAVLTRLVDDRDNKLTMRDKLKLYNGQPLAGYTEDMVKEIRDKHPDEGLKMGVSARYVQDQLSNTLAENYEYINFFMLANKLKENLRKSSLITDQTEISHYEVCVDQTIKEYADIVKREVQKALVADENAIERLCANYLDNLMSYIRKEKVTNPITGQDEEPNERLMREIEEKIGIPEQGADDFRLSISTFMGQLSHKSQKFHWNSDPRLKKALEAKLFEDTKDHIKLSALSSAAHVVDPEQQDKIDAIKARLVKHYGYNEKSATDVLQYVAQIFARGDVGDDD